MQRLPVIRHRTLNQIIRKCRACRDAREKTRWQVIRLYVQSRGTFSSTQIATMVGFSDVWVRKVLKRWNQYGPGGLRDGRHHNGKKPLLSSAQRNALIHALQAPSPDGGLWTGPKVARFVKDRWGLTINPATGWKWLQRLGFSLQVPRPSHPQSATPAQRRSWKRRLEEARAGPAPPAPGPGH